MVHRILCPMKVTTNLPDSLVEELKAGNPGKNLTEAVQIAIEAWLSQRKIRRVISEVRESPLEFIADAESIRKVNRS
jgi:hypothetical protein